MANNVMVHRTTRIEKIGRGEGAEKGVDPAVYSTWIENRLDAEGREKWNMVGRKDFRRISKVY